MPEIQVKDKLITLEELGTAYNNITPANIGAVAKAGDTMTGPLNFADSTWNTVGNDVQIGDCNIAGGLGIKGISGPTGIHFVQYNGSNAGDLQWDGANFNLTPALSVASGGTGATTAAVVITNNYSSVLNVINAVKGGLFPISIQKYAGASYSDMPSDYLTNEWNMLLFGGGSRITALLNIYQTSKMFIRHFYTDHWVSEWVQLHQ